MIYRLQAMIEEANRPAKELDGLRKLAATILREQQLNYFIFKHKDKTFQLYPTGCLAVLERKDGKDEWTKISIEVELDYLKWLLTNVEGGT